MKMAVEEPIDRARTHLHLALWVRWGRLALPLAPLPSLARAPRKGAEKFVPEDRLGQGEGAKRDGQRSPRHAYADGHAIAKPEPRRCHAALRPRHRADPVRQDPAAAEEPRHGRRDGVCAGLHVDGGLGAAVEPAALEGRAEGLARPRQVERHGARGVECAVGAEGRRLGRVERLGVPCGRPGEREAFSHVGF